MFFFNCFVSGNRVDQGKLPNLSSNLTPNLSLIFSARNAQLMGRDRQFAERFTNVLVAFNAIECADSVPYVPRTTNPDAYSAADKMARLVEILFYVTKNRKPFCTLN